MNLKTEEVRPARKIGSKIVLPERKIPILEEVEVLVVGGGVAGICASLASARGKTATMLLERYGYLGGMATGGLVLSMEGFNDGEKQVIKGIADEIVENLKGVKSYQSGLNGLEGVFDPEAFKQVALKMLLDSKVKILFHAHFIDTIMNRETIEGVIISTKLGPRAILAKVIIDTTGDGDVFAFSGALHEKAKKGIGLNFRIAGVNTEYLEKFKKEKPSEYERIKKKLELNGGFPESILPTIREKVIWWNNMLSPDDCLSVDALSKIEIELREKIYTTLKFLKKNFPGFEKSYLLDTSTQLGVRESRRLVGEYVLSKRDIIKGKRFSDAVVHAGYLGKVGIGYDIPYRCLIPKNIDGLIVAGRCISTDSYAQDAIRIIANCMATGEAAGYAACLSVKEKIMPRNLEVNRLREVLKKNGVYLE